jgi:hypothetical protein
MKSFNSVTLVGKVENYYQAGGSKAKLNLKVKDNLIVPVEVESERLSDIFKQYAEPSSYILVKGILSIPVNDNVSRPSGLVVIAESLNILRYSKENNTADIVE